MQYPKDVLSSKVKAGLFIRQACQRFMDDLKRPDLSFRRKAVDRCISFIEYIPFRWQQSMVSFSAKVRQPASAYCQANFAWSSCLCETTSALILSVFHPSATFTVLSKGSPASMTRASSSFCKR